jgi:hypothetical protein
MLCVCVCVCVWKKEKKTRHLKSNAPLCATQQHRTTFFFPLVLISFLSPLCFAFLTIFFCSCPVSTSNQLLIWHGYACAPYPPSSLPLPCYHGLANKVAIQGRCECNQKKNSFLILALSLPRDTLKK